MPELISTRPNGLKKTQGWLAVVRRNEGQDPFHEYERSDLPSLLCGQAAEEITLG